MTSTSSSPPRHAFLVNCHADIAQARTLAALLAQYWSPQSQIIFYLDGNVHTPEDLDDLRRNANVVLLGPYEPHKSISILNALNSLVSFAHQNNIEVASFLHADMIPTDKLAFYHFIDRFYRSQCSLSCTPMWPDQPVIDFCNLHFRLPQAIADGLFPVSYRPNAPRESDCNEYQLTWSFYRSSPEWFSRSYAMWTIVHPYTGLYKLAQPEGEPKPLAKLGHCAFGKFEIHNYTPESSVIHTNSPWFWQNYSLLARLN